MKFITRRAQAADHAATEAALIDSLNASYARLGEMSDRWTLGQKRGDSLRRVRCLLTGHDWSLNQRKTQKVCPRCWTVVELSDQDDSA